jgi:hypothetical protein
VLAHRFGGTVVALAVAVTDWMAAGGPDPAHGPEPVFVPSVALAGGWLYGSAVVSAQASVQGGPGRAGRIRLKPYTRVAIQMTVAVSLAIAAGDAVSGHRFYWAVIAVFATFMGTNNHGEQLRKGALRVAGTVVGITVGFAVAHAVGHHTNWTIVVVLVAMFLGFYLMRINYAFWVIFLVVAVSQVYVQAGEFTGTLLLTRLAETALGAAIAGLTVTFVLPLRTRHVLHVALRAQLVAMDTLVSHAAGQLLDHDATVALRSDVRTLDAAHQTLITTAQPLRQNLFGELDDTVGRVLGMAGAARDYGRNLVTDVGGAALDLDPDDRRLLERAAHTLHASLGELIGAVDGTPGGAYTRSAGLFDRIERHLEAQVGSVHDDQLALRDLMLIDQALAGLAAAVDLPVTSTDTLAEDAAQRRR